MNRVLVPGGVFLIVNEDDGLSCANQKWEKMIDGMHTYTPDELKAHLCAAGFDNIVIFRKESKRWLAVNAEKKKIEISVLLSNNEYIAIVFFCIVKLICL